MELKEHNCESIEFTTEISFDSSSWRRLAALFTKSDWLLKGLRKSQLIRSVLYETKKNVNYHYHFSARRFFRRNRQMLNLVVGVHPNIPGIRQRKKAKGNLEIAIPSIEPWISSFLPSALQRRELQLTWTASFTYSTKRFQPIFELPFKSPFAILDKSSPLAGASISGLKLDFQSSHLGLTTVYFEAFPKFLAVTAAFNQRLRIREKLVENFLVAAQKVAMLFVKPRDIE